MMRRLWLILAVLLLAVAPACGTGALTTTHAAGLGVHLGALGVPAGLKINNNATTPNTKLDVSADDGVLANSSGVLVEISNLSVTLDATTTGANGLDAGTLAASTWYYEYAIRDDVSSTNATLLSTSSMAPTLPSGYTYDRLLGTIVTDASAHFLAVYQDGYGCHYAAEQSVLSASTSTAYASVNLSAYVPPIAVGAQLRWLATATSTGAIAMYEGYSYLSLDGANEYSRLKAGKSGVTADSWYDGSEMIDIPLPTAQTVWYKTSLTSSPGGNTDASIWVQGYLLK